MPRSTPRARLTSPTPHTPSPSPLQFASSPATSPQPSPSKRGNAPPVESTFQRAFRGTVKNYELIRKNWTMLHGQGVEALKRLDRSTAALACVLMPHLRKAARRPPSDPLIVPMTAKRGHTLTEELLMPTLVVQLQRHHEDDTGLFSRPSEHWRMTRSSFSLCSTSW